MADSKTSALPAVVTPAGADEFPINQAGTSKKETLTQVSTAILGGSVPQSAGTVLAVAAIAPAATTGASQVGKAATVAASNAVASTDTAGAAAGGAVTLTSGNAARNASGNADGGAITLQTGAGIGTGVPGKIQVPGASADGSGVVIGTSGPLLRYRSDGGSPTVEVLDATAAAGGKLSVGLLLKVGGGTNINDSLIDPTNGRVRFISGSVIGLSSSATDAENNAIDTGITRVAAGVMGFTNSETPASVGGYYQFAGGKRVTGNQTVTDSTALVSSTDLTCTVTAGRHYTFRFLLYFTTVNTSGVKVAISGTATHTSITYDARIFGVSTPALLTIARATAKDTAVGVTATGTAAYVEITGSTTINAGGTLLVQFAQNAETGAGESAILLRGSSMEVIDMQ